MQRIDRQKKCYKGFIWNQSNCECECDKLCDVGEYLGYVNCNCRKRLVDKLIEECTENIEEAKINEITLFEFNSVEHKNKSRSSCTIYIVLIVIVLQSALELVLILFNTST